MIHIFINTEYMYLSFILSFFLNTHLHGNVLAEIEMIYSFFCVVESLFVGKFTYSFNLDHWLQRGFCTHKYEKYQVEILKQLRTLKL